ncbi:MAG: GDYXXLXY domain-containing protein [Synergistaceae bacterium]|nr:GDYXXLXY domain-containing protein [Synergistaceae bacterium]
MNSPKFLKSIVCKYAAIALPTLFALFYTQILNVAVLAMGEPVLLATRPVDPRDILMGDYVMLDYEISDIPSGTTLEDATDESGDKITLGDYRDKEVYVALEKDELGIGSVKSVSANPPADGLYIRGTYHWGGVGYGIGVYYVPEGTGHAIEEKINDSKIKVLVDARVLRGRPVIKGIRFADVELEPADEPGRDDDPDDSDDQNEEEYEE